MFMFNIDVNNNSTIKVASKGEPKQSCMIYAGEFVTIVH
jgi:hypothetical protein